MELKILKERGAWSLYIGGNCNRVATKEELIRVIAANLEAKVEVSDLPNEWEVMPNDIWKKRTILEYKEYCYDLLDETENLSFENTFENFMEENEMLEAAELIEEQCKTWWDSSFCYKLSETIERNEIDWIKEKALERRTV